MQSEVDINVESLITALKIFAKAGELTEAQEALLRDFFLKGSVKDIILSANIEEVIAPLLKKATFEGPENNDIKLQIGDSVQNPTEHSERLFVVITGFPEGAALSNGTYIAFLDAWIVKYEDFNNVWLIPPKDFNGDITFDIMAIGRTGHDFAFSIGTMDVIIFDTTSSINNGPNDFLGDLFRYSEYF
jgi:hypothetical protein